MSRAGGGDQVVYGKVRDTAFDRWLRRRTPLHAPEGCRWTDQDVQYEKIQSWMDGWLWASTTIGSAGLGLVIGLLV